MTARLLRLVAAALLVAALAWLALWWRQGAPATALLGALAIMLLQPWVLAAEFLSLPWQNRRDPAPPATAADLLRAWLREAVTALRVFQGRQAWREWAEPDVAPEGHTGHRAVVLVHGFFCNRALWNPWLRRLRGAGVPALAVNLEPSFDSIDVYAPQIDAAVERAWHATGLAPVLVGHSMGGLAIRAWWRMMGDAADSRVHHVITIGTPHHGTQMAAFSRARNARQMRRGSAWLRDLAAAEPGTRLGRFTCFYSHCDNIATPASTATLPGADNRHLPGWPHVALAFAPPVWEAVWQCVDPMRLRTP